MKPKLKQFGDLVQSDFDEHPVWVGVHNVDYGKEWYEETNEETFRPWDGEFPVDPKRGMFLVRARFVLKDKSEFAGFITPAPGSGSVKNADHGTVQPHIFIPPDKLLSFWGGLFGFSDDAKQMVYEFLGRMPKQIFPIRFSADKGYTVGRQSGKIEGFYQLIDFKKQKVQVTK